MAMKMRTHTYDNEDEDIHIQTCHFDLTQNLNKCEKKSEYTQIIQKRVRI